MNFTVLHVAGSLAPSIHNPFRQIKHLVLNNNLIIVSSNYQLQLSLQDI